MSWLALAFWELRNTLRELIPMRWLRRSLVVAFIGLVVLLSTVVLFLPPPRNRSADLNVLGGFFSLNLMAASALAGLSLSRLVSEPRKLELIIASPLGPARSLWLLLVPALGAGCIPLAALLLPFALAVARRAPDVALGMAGAASLILAWSVLIAVAAAAALVARFGRDRAAALLRSCGAITSIVAVLAFKPLVSLRAPGAVTLALGVAAVVLLPLAWPRTARRFFDELDERGSERFLAREPSWGAPGWFGELRRTLAPRMLAAPLVAGVLIAWRPVLLPLMLSLSLLFVVMVPVAQLLSEEWRCPERLRLAPRGLEYRLRLVASVGGAAWATSAAMAIALGWGHWTWVGGASAVALLALPVCLLPQRLVRCIAQTLLALLALSTSTLWQ